MHLKKAFRNDKTRCGHLLNDRGDNAASLLVDVEFLCVSRLISRQSVTGSGRSSRMPDGNTAFMDLITCRMSQLLEVLIFGLKFRFCASPEPRADHCACLACLSRHWVSSCSSMSAICVVIRMFLGKRSLVLSHLCCLELASIDSIQIWHAIKLPHIATLAGFIGTFSSDVEAAGG
jgi:hypothetical protein